GCPIRTPPRAWPPSRPETRRTGRPAIARHRPWPGSAPSPPRLLPELRGDCAAAALKSLLSRLRWAPRNDRRAAEYPVDEAAHEALVERFAREPAPIEQRPDDGGGDLGGVAISGPVAARAGARHGDAEGGHHPGMEA